MQLLSFFLVLLDKQHSSTTKFRQCALKTLSPGIKSPRLLAYPILLQSSANKSSKYGGWGGELTYFPYFLPFFKT